MTCPVALYPATTEADTVRFNLINPETNNRIRMKTLVLSDKTGIEVFAVIRAYSSPAGRWR